MICPGLCCTRNNKDDPYFICIVQISCSVYMSFSNIAIFLLRDSMLNLHIMKFMSYITCLH